MASSCKNVRQAFIECIKISDCMKKGETFHNCVKLAGTETPDISDQCRAIAISYYDCKRGQLDMTRRFRGNRDFGVNTEIDSPTNK